MSQEMIVSQEDHRPPVWIVVLNWNGWQDTLACLDSLSQLDYPSAHIVVVDNASADDSVVRLREAYPDLHLIVADDNLGFAGGNNLGIAEALRASARYIWLLNNDTVVDPQALTALVDTAESDPNIGIVGSKIYYFDQRDVLWYAGGEITPKGPVRHRGLDVRDEGQFDRTEDVDFVTGCSLLIRAQTVATVGLMRDEYFLYWEEVDWNERVRVAGQRIVYEPRSVLWHKVSASLGEDWGVRQTEYLARNMLLFYRLNRPSRILEMLARTVIRAVTLARLRHRALALATLRGLRDYLAGKTGPIG